ncbi:MAG: IclR family transcriptional regulator [Actinomycetota bacterium]
MSAARVEPAKRTHAVANGDGRPAFQILDRTFAILDLFDEERPEWTGTEIARALELPVPTTHRILMALKQRGYVSQHEETKRFRLGVGALHLGDRAHAAVDLRSLSLPVLKRLSRETGETALLTVVAPGGSRGVCLERVETAQPLRLSVQPGRRVPLHAGASQKALLAFLPSDAVDRVLSQPLERLCEHTIVDRQALRAEIARTRTRGWADSNEETNLGVRGIAIPVLSEGGSVVCAIGVAGPSARLDDARIALLFPTVVSAAEEISSALGHRVPDLEAPS